jgi:hypothetical protein
MTLVRFNDRVSVVAKVQAAIGTAETLNAAQDACLPYVEDGGPAAPEPYEYVFDGKVGRGAAQMTGARRVSPTGRTRGGTFRCLPRGRGAAYTASVFPPNEIHRYMLASGFDATFSATPTPRIIYTPTAPDTYGAVLTVQQWAQGSQYTDRDVIANWSFAAEGLGAPVFSFDWRGVSTTLPVDAGFPSITVDAATVQPFPTVAVLGSLGAFSAAQIRRASFNSNRGIDGARVAQNAAGGHAGFVRNGLVPTFEIEIERPARATFDPEALRDSAALSALSYQVNPTVQYNRFTLLMPQAQVVNVQPGNDGAIPTVTITYEGAPSTPTANDTVSAVWD